MTYLTKRAGTARAFFLFCIGALAIIAALWLRFSHTEARHAVTLALGHDGRAALEHALAALGLPLSMHMMFLLSLSSGLPSGYGVLSFVTMGLTVLRRWAGPALAAASVIFRNGWRQGLWTILRRVSCFLDRHRAILLSAAYFACALAWEHYQAWVSVYGGRARGHLQYDQLLADATGAMLAVLLARWFARGEQ